MPMQQLQEGNLAEGNREVRMTRTEYVERQHMLENYRPSEAALNQAKELERLLDIHNQRRFALDMQAPICVSPESDRKSVV